MDGFLPAITDPTENFILRLRKSFKIYIFNQDFIEHDNNNKITCI